MEQRMTILGLGVSDLEVANDFYENTFGWKKTAASNENISFFKLNGILLSLYPKDKLAEDVGISSEGSGFRAVSIAYNTTTKEEVDQLIEDLRSKGVRIVKEPQSVFWGGYSSYIADADGHLWEIAWNPYLNMDAKGNVLD